ncbi:MAG: hypothetical protein ACI9YE_002876, partial [Psychroserpens sp.]
MENNDIFAFYHIGGIDCGKFSLLVRFSQSDIDRLNK